MRRATVIALSAVTAAMLGACGGAGEGAPAGGGSIGETTGEPSAATALTIEERTPTRLAGWLKSADGQLAFSALTLETGALAMQLNVNGKAFDATLDAATIAIDGHDVILTSADRKLLLTFIDQFALHFAGATLLERDASLNGLALYLSEAPEGHVHRPVTTRGPADASELASESALTVGDEGVTCIKKSTTVTAVYTDRYGKVYEDPIVVGSKLYPLNGGTGDFGCMGKCGAGCTNYWFIRTGYTKDCLDHDACSRRFSASGGSSDPNCGDEYNAASYDFTHSSRCTGD